MKRNNQPTPTTIAGITSEIAALEKEHLKDLTAHSEQQLKNTNNLRIVRRRKARLLTLLRQLVRAEQSAKKS